MWMDAVLPLNQLDALAIAEDFDAIGSATALFTPDTHHALEAMTDVLRVELRPWGIEVVILEPGRIATPIWEKSRQLAGEIARQIVRNAKDPGEEKKP